MRHSLYASLVLCLLAACKKVVPDPQAASFDLRNGTSHPLAIETVRTGRTIVETDTIPAGDERGVMSAADDTGDQILPSNFFQSLVVRMDTGGGWVVRYEGVHNDDWVRIRYDRFYSRLILTVD